MPACRWLRSLPTEELLFFLGVDINDERCRLINQGTNPIPEEEGLEELIIRHGGKSFIATPRFEDARDCSSFIVIVPLFVDQSNNPDFSIMDKALLSLGRILKRGIWWSWRPPSLPGRHRAGSSCCASAAVLGKVSSSGLLPGEDNDRI